MAKIVRRTLDPANPPRLSEETKHRLDAMSDAAISKAAKADPDNPPLTDKELRAVKTLRKMGRPPLPPEERKQNFTMRAKPRTLDTFKATGPGYQTRMEEALDVWAMLLKDEGKRATVRVTIHVFPTKSGEWKLRTSDGRDEVHPDRKAAVAAALKMGRGESRMIVSDFVVAETAAQSSAKRPARKAK